MFWINEYVMALYEVERARLASQERENHRKEGPSDGESSDRDEQVYPPRNYSKEVTTCP